MYFKQSDFFAGMAHGFVKDIMANVEKTAYETDDVIPRVLVEAIEAFPWVRWVREIPSVTG